MKRYSPMWWMAVLPPLWSSVVRRFCWPDTSRNGVLQSVRRQRIPDFRRPDLRESFDSSGLLSGGFLSVVRETNIWDAEVFGAGALIRPDGWTIPACQPKRPETAESNCGLLSRQSRTVRDPGPGGREGYGCRGTEQPPVWDRTICYPNCYPKEKGVTG